MNPTPAGKHALEIRSTSTSDAAQFAVLTQCAHALRTQAARCEHEPTRAVLEHEADIYARSAAGIAATWRAA